jgi:hypothetical protein
MQGINIFAQDWFTATTNGKCISLAHDLVLAIWIPGAAIDWIHQSLVIVRIKSGRCAMASSQVHG